MLIIAGIVSLAVFIAEQQFAAPVSSPKPLNEIARAGPNLSLTNVTAINGHALLSMPSDSAARVEMNNVKTENVDTTVELRSDPAVIAKPSK